MIGACWRAPLIVGALLVCAPSAFAHTLDGKPCPDVVDTDIEAELENSIGLPILHDDTLDPDLIETHCRDRYCYAHSGELKTPLWVAQKMTRAIACGDNKRPKGWKPADGPDPKAKNADYTNSGYARGHNAASDDFKSSIDWMRQTFTFGNAVPQIQDGFNGSYWRFLEEDIKHLALSGRDLYVITGPIRVSDDGKPVKVGPSGQSCKHEVTIAGADDLQQGSICGGKSKGNPNSEASCDGAGVEVPAGMFKIVYFADTGRVFAYAAANIDHRSKGKKFKHHDDYLETWRVSVRTVEELTNIEFFPNVDQRTSEIDKNGCITTPRH